MSANALRSWIKKLGQQLRGGESRLRRRAGAANGREVAQCRLSVESLETRLTPAGSAWFQQRRVCIVASRHQCRCGVERPRQPHHHDHGPGRRRGHRVRFLHWHDGLAAADRGLRWGDYGRPTVANSQSSLISVTGGVSVELMGLTSSPEPRPVRSSTMAFMLPVRALRSTSTTTRLQVSATPAARPGRCTAFMRLAAAGLTISSSMVESIGDKTTSFGGVGVEVAGGSATLISDTITSYQADGIDVSGSATIYSTIVTGSNNGDDNQTGILINSGATPLSIAAPLLTIPSMESLLPRMA